jgi:hypothetical protein
MRRVTKFKEFKERKKKEKKIKADLAYEKHEKQVSKLRLAEKIPIIKRVVREMSDEEELILDSSLAVIHGLRVSLYKSHNSLTPAEKGVLINWLDLLNVALPPEWGIHSLVYELRQNIDFVSERFVNLDKILQKHPLARSEWGSKWRSEWSKSCMKGIACGYWKLFHVLSGTKSTTLLRFCCCVASRLLFSWYC